MGCYVVPTVAAVLLHGFRGKKALKDNEYVYWLNILFYGASIFGFVDHLWNGQLFSFNITDLLLGFTITSAILVFWGLMVQADKSRLKEPVLTA
jgi:hypothetical protein